MKAMVIAICSIAAAVVFALPGRSFAQVPDTVVVYANPGGETIERQIMGDTTATGQRVNPNRVYLLQQTGSLDTVYYYDDPITTLEKYNITIIGKRNPVTGMPPLIQPDIRPNNSSPGDLIVSNKSGVNITLKNLYILGERVDSVQATTNLLQINGDTNSVTIDHCVIDNISGNVANFANCSWENLKITNTELRDASNQFWRSGGWMWANFGVPMDSVIIQNTTWFCNGRQVMGGPGIYNYLLIDHNTFFISIDAPMLSTHLTNATITNNIWYGMNAHGADSSYVATGQTNNAKEPYSLIMLDSLGSVGSTYGVSESQRRITVENNAYFWPQQLLSFWTAVNDTAKGWYISEPEWMNSQTFYMFSDHSAWPNLVSQNNDSTDPGFAASLVNPAIDSTIEFVKLIGWNTPTSRFGNTGAFRFWQLRSNPDPSYIFTWVPSTWTGWTSGYPVPENLAYSNVALQTAGKGNFAVGDLNWYPSQLKLWEAGDTVNAIQATGPQVPTNFTLSQNYPNPFNPTTDIAYSVPKTGIVTLAIFNILGEKVATLFSGVRQPGNYLATFNGSKFASGMYFYRLQSSNLSITKKLMLIK